MSGFIKTAVEYALRMRRGRELLVAAAVVVMAAVLGWSVGRISPQREKAFPEVPTSLSWSADGTRIAGSFGSIASTWIWDLRDDGVAFLRDDPEVLRHKGKEPWRDGDYPAAPTWSPIKDLLLVGWDVYNPVKHTMCRTLLPGWFPPVWLADGENLVAPKEIYLFKGDAYGNPDHSGTGSWHQSPNLSQSALFELVGVSVSPDGTALALHTINGGWHLSDTWRKERVMWDPTWRPRHIPQKGDGRSTHLEFMKADRVLFDVHVGPDTTYAGHKDWGQEMHILALDRATPDTLTVLGRGVVLAASRTRDECAIWRDGTILVIDSRGRTLARLVTPPLPAMPGLAWSPDGDRLAVAVSRKVQLFRIH